MIPHVDDSKKGGNELNDDDVKAEEIPWLHRLILNRPSKVIAIILIVSILMPILFYHFVFYPSTDLPPSDGFSVGSCIIPRAARLPCGLAENSSECHPQCCFDVDNNICFHRFPSRFSYILDEPWAENVTLRPRIQTVPFNSQTSVPELKLSVDEITPTHMSLTFYNSGQLTGRRIETKQYYYHISDPELNIVVNDTSGNYMFNTVRGSLIAAENIWEITFRLTEEYMFGLGEIPLKENTTRILYNHEAGLSSVPLIFSKTNDTFHGLLIDVQEPTEVRIQGDNLIVVRSITKSGFKFHLFAGPTPKDVMLDVRKLLGFKDKFKYWMLGAHICSENSTSEFRRSTRHEALRDFLQQASDERLPYESHCGTDPIVFETQCEDEDNEVIDDIRTAETLVRNYNKRFVPHVSPYILYKEPNKTSENSTENYDSTEIEQDVIEKNETCNEIIQEFKGTILNINGTLYKGLVGNDSVIYPDYEEEDFKEFLIKLWRDIEIDGAVLVNSWPLDQSFKLHNETYQLLPYFNENFESAFNHTPQWNISRPNGEIYFYTHNKYGNHFANALRKMSSDDIPLWTPSQRLNTDIVSKQNVKTTWADLQHELTDAALGGISGQWLWASPVCGDTENYNNVTNVNLCVKWYMAASYLPLVNIHSKIVRRDALSFGGTNKLNIVTALNRRLTLLPYIYTTLQDGPLLRPMFYQFPSSKILMTLTSQFSVGEDLLIVPNLQPDQTHVHVVKPPGTWHELWSGLLLEGEEGETLTMTTTESDFLTLMRAGGVIAMQKNAQETAEETRLRSDYSLTIALNCEVVRTENNSTEIGERILNKAENDNTTECLAKGKLFMTENMTIVFEADAEVLKIRAEGEGFSVFCGTQDVIWAQRITDLNIYGLKNEFNNFDHHRQVRTSIDLCELQAEHEIVFEFLN